MRLESFIAEEVGQPKLRMRIRREYTASGTNWVQTNEVHYIYDGNLPVQERDLNNLPVNSYTRGRDMSGSLQGAGGIGGMLAMSVGAASPQHYCYHADGNGNNTAMINASQAIAAKYLYDPYGNLLSQSGPMAALNHYRFSSKEALDNSGLVYYLYRFYDPNLQRWVNRDPIAERGGINMNTFVASDPLGYIDAFGLAGGVTHNTPGCLPGDSCATLATKIALWVAHLDERIDELLLDENSLKTTNPIKYNNHVFETYKAVKNLSRCYTLFQDKTPPCCEKPPDWKARRIPSYVNTTSGLGNPLLLVPGSDNFWLTTGNIALYTAGTATLVGATIATGGGALALAPGLRWAY